MLALHGHQNFSNRRSIKPPEMFSAEWDAMLAEEAGERSDLSVDGVDEDAIHVKNHRPHPTMAAQKPTRPAIGVN